MFNSKTKQTDFLEKINYLTAAELNGNLTIDKLKKLNPVLNEFNPLAHSVIMKLNKDLTEEEFHFHKNAIEILSIRERQQVAEALKVFEHFKKINKDLNNEDSEIFK